jgi:hypothetical protein
LKTISSCSSSGTNRVTIKANYGTVGLMFFYHMQGWIQDFKLGEGVHLKKLRRAEGGAKIFGVFRVKNHDFTPKNHIFSNLRGGGGELRVRPPPWIHPWYVTKKTTRATLTQLLLKLVFSINANLCLISNQSKSVCLVNYCIMFVKVCSTHILFSFMRLYAQY